MALHDRVDLPWMQDDPLPESLCEWVSVPSREKSAPWGNSVSGGPYVQTHNDNGHDNMSDPIIRLSPEFDDSNAAPASYWLKSWDGHRAACEAINEARNGQRSSFEGPRGLVMVSPDDGEPGPR